MLLVHIMIACLFSLDGEWHKPEDPKVNFLNHTETFASLLSHPDPRVGNVTHMPRHEVDWSWAEEVTEVQGLEYDETTMPPPPQWSSKFNPLEEGPRTVGYVRERDHVTAWAQGLYFMSYDIEVGMETWLYEENSGPPPIHAVARARNWHTPNPDGIQFRLLPPLPPQPAPGGGIPW